MSITTNLCFKRGNCLVVKFYKFIRNFYKSSKQNIYYYCSLIVAYSSLRNFFISEAKPTVMVATTVLDIPLGDKIVLTCNGSSIPGPLFVTWKRNDTILSNHTYGITFLKINTSLATSTLTINASKHEDTGGYICVMGNKYLNESSQIIDVTILGNLC